MTCIAPSTARYYFTTSDSVIPDGAGKWRSDAKFATNLLLNQLRISSKLLLMMPAAPPPADVGHRTELATLAAGCYRLAGGAMVWAAFLGLAEN